ncbi:uncharacterized protein SCHCODRAFT_02731957 [Schizophyllum commune H4-8]|nr:uncharacterized protein SCHCODRAFT_02731957 [Schizophyllum commune H4-8]KAI5891915.1 hypothetical protein SCHCODRAFT_02731957 [Schizophyllum commune H4-8]
MRASQNWLCRVVRPAATLALPATHAHLIGALRLLTTAHKQPFWEPLLPPTVIALHTHSRKSRSETRVEEPQLSSLALMMNVFWRLARLPLGRVIFEVAAHCPVEQLLESAAGVVEGLANCIRLCLSKRILSKGEPCSRQWPLSTALTGTTPRNCVFTSKVAHAAQLLTGNIIFALIIAVSSAATIFCGIAPSVGCWIVMYFVEFQKFSIVVVIWLVGSSMSDILHNVYLLDPVSCHLLLNLPLSKPEER